MRKSKLSSLSLHAHVHVNHSRVSVLVAVVAHICILLSSRQGLVLSLPLSPSPSLYPSKRHTMMKIRTPHVLSFQHLRHNFTKRRQRIHSRYFQTNYDLSSLSTISDISSNRIIGSRISIAKKVIPRSHHDSTTLLHLSNRKKNQVDYNNSSYDFDNIEKELQNIQSQAKILNDHVEINLNSPKQIANALYKEGYNVKHHTGGLTGAGTGKEILQTFASYDDDNSNSMDKGESVETHKVATFQKELATLVLQYRELKQMIQSLQKNDVGNMNTEEVTKTKRVTSSSNLGKRRNSMSSIHSFSTLANTSISSNGEEVTIQNGINKEKDGNDSTSKSSIPKTTHQLHHSTNTAYNLRVDNLFNSRNSQINKYWQKPLQSITKPSARAIVLQLSPSCPMGYDPTATAYDAVMISDGNENLSSSPARKATTTSTAGKKGSLLSYVREQKMKYSDSIVITRVGEFYEAFGIDALLLIENCGLNSMAGKARAGCPLKNIQATLDCLTSAGYRVAVYEEVMDTDASLGGKGLSGGPKSRLKNRMLAQIVSPASPTYLYNLVLGDGGSTGDTLFGTPSARPYVGIISNAAGYSLVETSFEERTVRVSERLTAEAVACRLSAYPPAEPLFYVPSPGDQSRSLPFLPSNRDTMRDGSGTRFHVEYLKPDLYMPSPREGVSDVQRSKQCIISALLQITEIHTNSEEDSEKVILTHDDFTLLPSSIPGQKLDLIDTNPLYVETAIQLGLMMDPTIPQLVKYLVPDSAPLPTRRFLRRWLLTPPPHPVTSSMAELVAILKEDDLSLPPMAIPPVGKVLSLIRAGQASAQVFRDVLMSIESTVNILNVYNDKPDIVSPLMSILRYESGIDAEKNNLKERCLDTMQIISNVVQPHDGNKQNKDSISSDRNGIVPPAFFDRNEVSWRGRIKPDNAVEAYDNVLQAANELIEAIAVDFWGAIDPRDMSTAKELKSPIVQDIFNNLIALKEIPSWASRKKEKYYHPRDRNGKLLRNRYTTARVDDAVSSYVEACEFATASVSSVLSRLSETLCETGHLPAISQAAHTNLILSTATHHAIMANYLGWNMAKISSDNTDNSSFEFQNVWPYWMDKSESVLNSFNLNGMFLLTAPNMSGKSTIMRSTASAALLTNCGLCAPLEDGSTIPRFDNIFVRGASSDIPTENKSAFGAEMQDIAALLRACGDKSLVFVDELGRGTSPTDGAALAGAVLEEMASKGMKGFFATHLHSILDLPLVDEAQSNIRKKRMETTEDSWTYKIVDGVCTDSQALKTAAKFGIPENILKRAEGLSYIVKNTSKRSSSDVKSSMKEGGREDEHPPFSIHNSLEGDKIKEALSVIERISDDTAVYIPPNWTPPPSLEGNSVVYVILVKGRYYIGETDSLAKRIRQHRSKSGWANGSTLAVKVEGGKTNARNLESLLIRNFASAGLPLLSVVDGQKIRPRNR